MSDAGDDEELVYVEESQPILPAPLIDNLSLKYTSNGDQCTLGEVAEKVMEINVDDPYDLCSLLVAEKKLSPTDIGSVRRRRKMLLNNGTSNNKMHEPILVRRNKSFVSTMLPKGKDGRAGGKSQVCKYPFKCSRCDSWFVDSADLKVHMSTHKEKSFKSVKDFIHEKIFKKTEMERAGNPPPPAIPSLFIKTETPPHVLVETMLKKEPTHSSATTTENGAPLYTTRTTTNPPKPQNVSISTHIHTTTVASRISASSHSWSAYPVCHGLHGAVRLVPFEISHAQ